MERNYTQGEERSQLPLPFLTLILMKFHVTNVESTENLITSRDVPGGSICGTGRQDEATAELTSVGVNYFLSSGLSHTNPNANYPVIQMDLHSD
jgi:hypothetical protein